MLLVFRAVDFRRGRRSIRWKKLKGAGTMNLFRKPVRKTWDPASQKPMLHKSICTGETTAGFKDLATGKFMDLMLIRNEADLKEFMESYGLKEVPQTEY